MPKQDGSIPTSADSGSTEDDSGYSRRNIVVALIVVLVAGTFLASKMFATEQITDAPTVSLPQGDVDVDIEDEIHPEWPPMMMKIGGTIEYFPNIIPVTTKQAREYGWVKAEEECNSFLGEPWLYGGERSIDSSATLYFTPDVGSVPGIVSGIEVDYYGHFEESMLTTYFSEERIAKDGTYHSVALSLRDHERHDLCDPSRPISHSHLERITLAPGMANENIPLNENSTELQDNWKEGSCIKYMGYHWIRDIVGGSDITYEASNLVPLVPMYNSTTGDFQSVFFLATDGKQNWPADCAPDPVDPSQPCAAPSLNFWDRIPGLSEANSIPFYVCSNFCDAKCGFTGSPDGMYTTMHWMFFNAFIEDCGGAEKRISCRNDEYPELHPIA